MEPREDCPETPYLRQPGYAERYRDQRFSQGSGAQTHRRETRAIEVLLGLLPSTGAGTGGAGGAGLGLWLDMPCGVGRLSQLLPGPTIGCDRSVEMLEACTRGQEGQKGPRTLVCASGLSLPFADRSFAGVLCMRLLHHIGESQERVRILSELARVSRGPVLVSFFHCVSLQHARRLLRRSLGRPRSGRHAIGWRQFKQDLQRAGLRLLARRPLRRFVSEQWLVLATRCSCS